MSKRKCVGCGEADDVAKGKDGRWLCGDCDARYVVCAVCGETHEEDSTCRHVYWAPGVGWCGSGSEENGADVARDDFLAILPRLDAVPGLVRDVLDALRADGPVVHDWRREGIILFHRQAEFVPNECTPEAESIRAGWDWLASLDGDATAHANAATAIWIEEWLCEREAAHADA